MGRGALLLVVLGMSACPQRDANSGAANKEREDTSTTTTTTTSTTTTTTTKTTAATTAGMPVEVRGVVLSDGIGISVRALEAVELGAAVQLVAEGAAPASVLTLRLDCRSQGCVKLAAGAELLAPPWLEQVQGERCDGLFRPSKAGEYRLRVMSCDGARRAETLVRWAPP